MNIILRLLCWFAFHKWIVSKATGLNRHVCKRCGKTEFRYGKA